MLRAVHVALPSDTVVLVVALLLGAGVVAAGFAERLRLPSLLIFLGLGMAIGDDGLELISFNDARAVQAGAAVALALILYEGGLGTKPGDLRQAAVPGTLLATVGVAITAAVTAGIALLVLDVSVLTGLLLGAIIASTDAAAVLSVLRRTPLPRNLTSVLEVESGTNDPVAIVLTAALVAAAVEPPETSEVVVFFVVQLVGGVALGLVVGWLGSELLRRARLDAEGLYPVLSLAIAGLAYGGGAWLGTSGFVAVYVTGLIVGARVPRHRRSIRAFHEAMASTAEIGLFLLLGLLVFPSRLPAVTFPALAVAAVLTFVARPAAVSACLLPLRYTVPEVAVVSWAGLRGAVPIVLATFPLTAGLEDGRLIFDVVFYVVLVSAALQGLTVAPLAQRLGLLREGSVFGPIAEAVPLEGVDADIIELDVHPDLAIVGRKLKDVPLPAGARLTMVMRSDEVVIPTGDTELQAGDLALVAVKSHERATEQIVKWAKGEAS